MSSAINTILQNFQQRRPLRAGSLIITIYGDCLMPRCGEVWLGSLINILKPFGLSPRLTRTAIYRLTQDNWLTAKPIGRRSYYQISPSGRASFKQAFKRIYATSSPPWQGDWTLVIIALLDQGQRKLVRQKLTWLGFGHIGPHTAIHPSNKLHEVNMLLHDLDLQDKVSTLHSWHGENQQCSRSESSTHHAAQIPPALLAQSQVCWDLQSLGEEYQKFLDLFHPLLADISALTDEQAFHARTLLIHEYRRILLKDPVLPDELLSDAWQGRKARELCCKLYAQLWQAAEQYIDQQLQTVNGPLPPVDQEFLRRFGGLS